MIKWLLLVSVCLVVLCIPTAMLAAPASEQYGPPSEQYELLYEDEFEGTHLNEEEWDYRTGTSLGGVNKPENISVSDGRVYVTVKQEADGAFTCGGIVTKIPLSYGYYEAKGKTFAGTGGLHTSFWTAGPANSEGRDVYKGGGGAVNEIDAYEIDSEDPDIIKIGLMEWILDRVGYTYPVTPYREVDSSAADFVVGFEWLPDRIVYYVNGKKVKEDLDPKFYAPGHVWLTGLMMPNVRGKTIDPSKLPGQSSWDYFRYYAMPITGANLMGNSSFEYQNNLIGGTEPGAPGDVTNVFSLFRNGTKDATFAHPGNDAHTGYYYLMHSYDSDYEVLSSQKKFYIPNGEYTFSAYVRSSGGQEAAYLAAYDKNGNLVCKQDIEKSENIWTKVSMPVTVTDNYMEVGVYSKANKDQWLKIDDWFFGVGEGETSEYTIKNEYDIRFTSIPERDNLVGSYVIELDDPRCELIGDWRKSSLGDSLWLFGTDVDGSFKEGDQVKYTFTAPEDNEYAFEFYSVTNPGSDVVSLTVTTPTEEQVHHINQFNGSTKWMHYGTYSVKKGDEIVVLLKPGGVGTTRAGAVRFTPNSNFENAMSPRQMVEEQLVLAIDKRWALKNNTRVAIDDNTLVTPFIENSRTLVPLRFIAEALGATVDYEGETRKITITSGDDIVELFVGGMEILVNGESKPLDVAANTYYDRTYVPLRAVSEAFGKAVTWNNKGVIYIGETTVNFAEKDDEIASYVLNDLHPIVDGRTDYTVDTINKYSDEILIMNLDSEGFSYEGAKWAKSGVMTGSVYATSSSSTAIWTPNIPKDGKYVVEFYNINYSAPIYNVRVATGGEETLFVVNPVANPNGWLNLGTFDMKAGKENYVKMRGGEDSKILKVRFIPEETYLAEKDGQAMPKQLTVTIDKQETYKNEILMKAMNESGDAVNGLTAKGTWLVSKTYPGTVYLDKGVNGYLKWNPEIPADGKYVVEFYNIGKNTGKNPFHLEVVTTNGEVGTCAFRGQDVAEGWCNLGVYDFKKGSDNYLRLWGGIDTRASKVRFIPFDSYEQQKAAHEDAIKTDPSDRYDASEDDVTQTDKAPSVTEKTENPATEFESVEGAAPTPNVTADKQTDYNGAIEMGVSEGEKGLSSVGTWKTSSAYAGSVYLEKGENAYLKWNPEIPADGKYVVEFYNVGKGKVEKSSRLEVKSADGTGTACVFPGHELDAGWYSLGTYDFKKGSDNYLRLWGASEIRAVKVRFIPLSAYGNQHADDEQVTVGQAKYFVETTSNPIVFDEIADAAPTPDVIWGVNSNYDGAIEMGVSEDENGLTSEGTWKISKTYTGTIYLEKGSNAYLKWNPVIPEDGKYVVEFYNVGKGKVEKSSRLEVKSADGTGAACIFPGQELDAGWYSLGVYDFKKGTDNYLRLWGGIEIRAQKVRFIPMSAYGNQLESGKKITVGQSKFFE